MKTVRDACSLQSNALSIKLSDQIEQLDELITVQRFVTIGTNVFWSLMVVVHTPSGEGVRIISVRKPDPRERRTYEKGV